MTLKLWALFIVLLLTLALLPVPGSFVARFFKIPSSAMEPTLMGSRNGNTPDHIIVDQFSYLFATPERGDLLVFKTSGIHGISQFQDPRGREIYYIKRLIGFPGEKVEIKEGAIFVDGKQLGESEGIPGIQYTDSETTASSVKKGGAYLVGDSEYFVLGDNTQNSADSRFWGYVPESAVIGKVTKIYFPFSRAGRPNFPSSSEKRNE